MNRFLRIVFVGGILLSVCCCPLSSTAQSKSDEGKASGDPFEPAAKKEKRSASPSKEIAEKMVLREWSESCHLKVKAKLNRVYFKEKVSESYDPFDDVGSIQLLGEDNKLYDADYSSLNDTDKKYVSNFVSWWKSHKDGGETEGGSLFRPPLAPREHWKVKVSHKYTYTKTEQTGWDYRFPHHVNPAPGVSTTVYPPVYGPVQHTGTKFVFEEFEGEIVSYEGKEATFKTGGKSVSYVVSRLHEDDQKWIRKWESSERQAKLERQGGSCPQRQACRAESHTGEAGEV